METALDIAVTCMSVAVVGFYSWSLRAHFSSPQVPSGFKVISAVVTLTTLYFLYLVWSVTQPLSAQIVGLGLEIAAAVMFWWAIAASRKARLRFAFDPDNPDSLVTTGPYRYVRHPFYTSYIIFWAGWGIATWTIWSVLPVIAFVVIYVIAAKGEEKKFASTPLAAEYDAYRRRTGFLIPKLLAA
ncbi:isoprenylcysteine carboxylmethyltransferase family protein [Mycoplana sp. MJR14]|uniref:methyltransferase family protein n=1 Tax=Mycoplana sp. MJR14 TaxID=3032583 RepID=UPI000DD54A1B|nr:isoprenylcysteine carboxylmethyltransferase family protein [Mycoplana sp. MJR14]MDF1633399.1 isoprenylcysteine carboxylmethyltransferase family protein [Mycoplana sp. MJR14]